MILGTIDQETGRPYVQGRLVLPRLRFVRSVDFWVDTGADCTVVFPADLFLLGVDYAHLRGDVPIWTAGGLARGYVEPGLLMFAEENRRLLRGYGVRFVIVPPSPDNLSSPSLLGLDVTRRWTMRSSPSKRLLRFTVVSADWTIRA